MADFVDTRRKIVRQLRNVIDPELGVNIVDLGLVYSISLIDEKVIVEYTATTPGCPMRRYLQQQVEKALDKVEEIDDYEVCLVWEPEWNVDMIAQNVSFFAHPPPQRN